MQVNSIDKFYTNKQPTFAGYKNIISNTITEDFCQISYMSMELNNDNYNDLDKWVEIQKKLLKIDEPSKHLILLTSLRAPNGHSFETRSFQTIGPKEFLLNLNIEKQLPLTLKAYTLLASITKRIMGENEYLEDCGLQSSLDELKNVFTKNYDANFAKELTLGLLNKKDHKSTARRINKQIDKNLKTYFAKVR